MTAAFIDEDWDNREYVDPDYNGVLNSISNGSFWDDPESYEESEDEYAHVRDEY